MKDKVLKLIEVIRESFKGSVIVYTLGSCYQFYLILKEVFPEARCYYDSNHVITRIGDSYYDITGEVKCERHLPIEDFGENHVEGEYGLKNCKYTGLV